MISPSYNINEFLASLTGKTTYEAVAAAQNEVYEAEQLTRGGRRGAPKARELGCNQYAEQLKGLIFYFENNVHPNGVSNGDYLAFQNAATKLSYWPWNIG